MTHETLAGARRPRPDGWILLLLVVVGAAFLIGFGARPAVLLPVAAHDDALFVKLGRALAMGEWLGPYDQNTLVKGAGFPAFLALLNLLGLDFPLGLAAFHLTCAAFLGYVVWRALDSRLLGGAIFLLALFLPPLAYGDVTRVFRDVFYTSLTMAVMAAAIALVTGRALPRWTAAVLAGGLGAWLWLTREEGIWLAPAFGLLALAPLLPRPGEPATLRARARRLAPVAVALGTGIALVGLFGLVNWAVYGRFVVNEIKDPAFQGAMDALQEAAAPYATTKLPVPRQARAQIYRVSPAFSTVRSPILDGPDWRKYAAPGCALDRRLCGDIGGGWFMWYFREAAAGQGRHSSPSEAAAFYAQVDQQVSTACEDGRLKCEAWRVPLAPPMRAEDLDDLGRSLAAVAQALTFAHPVWTSGVYSDLSGPGGQAMYEFLNRPHYEEAQHQRRLEGWLVGQGEEWFELRPRGETKIIAFERRASPDLVTNLGDPRYTAQRFALDVECSRLAPCKADLLGQTGSAMRVDLAALGPGPHQLGPARLYVDSVGPTARPFLKTRISELWLAVTARLGPLYAVIVYAGLAAFAVLLVQSLVRRRIDFPLLLAAALLAAVLARALILALIDALSFPAANHVYALPAMPLLMLFAVVSLHACVRGFLSRRRRPLG